MQKPKRLQHLISASLSVCLLLSFTISFLTNSAVGRDNLLASTAFDGSMLPSKTFIDRFNRIVLQNDGASTAIKSFEYHLLNTVQSDNVIAGKQDFFSVFCIQAQKSQFFLQAAGELPLYFLKKRIKFETLSNPHKSAISFIVI